MLHLAGTRVLRSLGQATLGQQRALAVLVQDVKNRQSPLKAKYAEEPASAIVLMKAEGTICNETMSVKVKWIFFYILYDFFVFTLSQIRSKNK